MVNNEQNMGELAFFQGSRLFQFQPYREFLQGSRILYTKECDQWFNDVKSDPFFPLN